MVYGRPHLYLPQTQLDKEEMISSDNRPCSKRRRYYNTKEKENDEFTKPLGMFIIGFIIFALYLWGLLTMIYRGHRPTKRRVGE